MVDLVSKENPWEKYYRSGNPDWKGSPFPFPGPVGDSKALDVGCGTGSTVLQALDMGYNVWGIDISGSAIEKCRARLELGGFYAHLVKCDFLEWKSDERFDTILLHHFLSSLKMDERGRAVEKAREFLYSGGIISFQDFSIDDFRYGKGKKLEENTFLKGNSLTCHFFSEDEVRDLFDDMEIMVLETRSWGMGPKGKRKLRSRIRALIR
mgnify:FL=1